MEVTTPLPMSPIERTSGEPNQKRKVSRERQLKINEASRRSRKKQKMELLYLREHVAVLTRFIEEHHGSADKNAIIATMQKNKSDSSNIWWIHSDQRTEYKIIGRFIRENLYLECQGFCPDRISSMPIDMDGWKIRLSITAKSFSIYNEKFFPCNYKDLFQFCWENHTKKELQPKNANHYNVVIPLADDLVFVDSKGHGRWSLDVHGVNNVQYTSLLSRMERENMGFFCQQSLAENYRSLPPDTIPWLFKRWVSMVPAIVNGVPGTKISAYRTAAYANGMDLYSATDTYDNFCEHIIRRYAESNIILERLMERDGRFPGFVASPGLIHPVDSLSDGFVAKLLLF